MQRIAVIDYGMGNLRSVAKALEAVSGDTEVVVTSDAGVIGNSDRIVCPGQGAARDCMSALNAAELGAVISQSVSEKPFLGICMGLQVLMGHSDENGGVDCLDVVPGEVRHFDSNLAATDGAADSRSPPAARLKVPHMGWSMVAQTNQHVLWEGIENHTRFYFAHSYYVVPSDWTVVAAECLYGVQFAAAVHVGNIFACQFHPEKSADAGLRLLQNFSRWSGGQ